MTQRTITIKIDDDGERRMSDRAYADLAHALWAVAYAAHRDRVHVLSDGRTESRFMNERWKRLGEDLPWAE